ncbi:MAG: fimbrillin family protein [Prevotella sp.]|nr:fimbrillin family protein [Candidatus Prevotella equi]
MKKAILNLALCAVALAPVVSCTNEEMTREEKQQAAITEMLTEGMKPSAENISLMGSNSTADESRAPIYTNDNDKGQFFETKDHSIGIFMLAKKVCDENISDGKYSEYAPYKYLKVDWTSPKDAENPQYSDVWSVYLKNVRAKADYVKNAADEIVGTKLNFHPGDLAPTDSRRFYPMGAYHNYWFYGYAPFDKAEISAKPARMSALFKDLNGTQDVIYGIGKPDITDTHATWAYSAKYFRFSENRDPVTDVPDSVTMKFSHKMMMVRLKITAGGTPINSTLPDVDRNYSGAYATTVEKINFTNVPSVMELILADNDDNTKDGTFLPAEGATRTKVYSVNVNTNPKPKYPNYEIGKDTNVPDTIEVGTVLLPVITGLKENPYMISVSLKYQGISLPMLVPMRLPVAVDEYSNDYFKPGYIYDVVLKIYQPEDINLNATLKPWVESTTSPFISPDGDGTFPIH